MKILVTGAAGFIGFHVAKVLAAKGHEIYGIDNINDYYDVNLKYARLEQLGINQKEAEEFHLETKSRSGESLWFTRVNLEDDSFLSHYFKERKFDVVCNLAAQAGVRYSLENPKSYVDSNLVGFVNILENCRNFKVKHLVYASSSSVYGLNKKVPFETTDNVDHPISLYAATKKSNELMAHTYSHLFGFNTTGLRFFTVYGPWGRPDMAMFLFTKAILKGEPIKVFNNGELERDFTYIDDIVNGVIKIIEKPVHKNIIADKYRIFNIGNNNAVKLTDFIGVLEKELKISAKKDFMPMQPGDVKKTWANVDDLISEFGYEPNTSINMGVHRFVNWYKEFYLTNNR